jgi:SpoVK/Ycf46/Vps4 family AAA+-type ATPase
LLLVSTDVSNTSTEDQNKHNEQKQSEEQSETEIPDLSQTQLPSSQIPSPSMKEEQSVTMIESKMIDKPFCSIKDVPSSNEVILSQNVQELEPGIVDVKKVQNSKKLKNLLNWLHNEPPLTSEQLAQLCIKERDFDIALKTVQPSAKREGFATVPDVTWDDIGSLQDIRQELQMSILVFLIKINYLSLLRQLFASYSYSYQYDIAYIFLVKEVARFRDKKSCFL